MDKFPGADMRRAIVLAAVAMSKTTNASLSGGRRPSA